MKRVVILGGGFGGVRCALTLDTLLKKASLNNVQVTLIDKNRYHSFIPALYEVASAASGVSEDTLYSRANILLKEILARTNVKFVKAEITAIHSSQNQKYVEFADGNGLDFDCLVIALGAQTNFYNIPGLKEHAIDLKDFVSALKIRRAIKLADQTPRTILVGGGGATGVELSAELASCLREQSPSITIVEGAGRVLPSFDHHISSLAAKRLKKLGISLKLGNVMKEVTHNQVTLADGQRLAYDQLFWTGGIIPHPLVADLSFDKERGFLKVDDCLRLLSEGKELKEGVFAIGDSCVHYDAKGNLIPWTAQKAIAEGKQAAINVVNHLKDQEGGLCKPQTIRFIIPIGGKWAIVRLNHFFLYGFLGWGLKNLVELKYLLSILPWYRAFGKWLATMITFSHND